MPNNEPDLSIEDLDNDDDVKGGGVARPAISEPGIGRGLTRRPHEKPADNPEDFRPGIGGVRLPSDSRPR